MTADDSAGQVLQRLKSILGELLDIPADEIGDEWRLRESDQERSGLNLDSLDVLRLTLALGDEYPVLDPVDEDWSAVTTVRGLAQHIASLVPPRRP
jgi:acyl carrier protein